LRILNERNRIEVLIAAALQLGGISRSHALYTMMSADDIYDKSAMAILTRYPTSTCFKA
jgi:hypothetical protein